MNGRRLLPPSRYRAVSSPSSPGHVLTRASLGPIERAETHPFLEETRVSWPEQTLSGNAR